MTKNPHRFDVLDNTSLLANCACFEAAEEYVHRNGTKLDDIYTLIDSVEADPVERTYIGVNLSMASTHAIHGRSRVILHGHKYAAALMLTNTRGVDARPPFHNFFIDVPPGLIPRLESDLCIARIGCMVLSTGDVFLVGYIRVAQTLVSDRFARLSAAEFLNSDLDLERKWADGCSRIDLAKREWSAIIALTKGVCLAMSDPDHVSPVGIAHKHGSTTVDQVRRDTLYKVGRPVIIDVRERVTDWVLGRDRKASYLKWVVRGHWRNQACGPSLSERRPRWIEPYWKGDDNAPELIRPHVLGGSDA